MKDGFYWIKPCKEWDWEIALLQMGALYFPGSDEPDKIEDMLAIGDYIPMPSKYVSP